MNQQEEAAVALSVRQLRDGGNVVDSEVLMEIG